MTSPPITLGEPVFYRTRTRAQQDLNDLLGDDVFDFPKDVEVLARVLEATTRNDDLVLDFFAGSGTLAEACMAINARDGGARRYVLAQLPEPLDTARYADLAALCRDRVRRAGERRDVPAGPLRGFRAYRLDASALQRSPAYRDGGPITLQIDDARPGGDCDDEALLAEVLLSRGLLLTTGTVWRTIGSLRAADVADGALLACFADTIDVDQFESLVAEGPAQIVILESAFGARDEVKVNALAHLRTTNAHRDTPIELLLL